MARGNHDMIKKPSKLRQYIGAPKRFLIKARDFYVDSMVTMDEMLAGNNVMVMTSCPAPPPISQTLFPSNNNLKIRDENLLPLRRSSTTLGISSKLGKSSVVKKKDCFEGGNRYYSSVGLGKIDTIDEDKPYEFHEHHNAMFARSRSHAVTCRNAYYLK